MFKSEEGKQAILKLYCEKLKSLSIDYSTLTVDTSFGRTNIIITGNPSNPPLVLIHGANGCAPVALDVYPKLADKFHVHSIDVIGEPNLSADNKMNKKERPYGLWLNEVLDKLNLNEVILAGFSLGGMVIWQTLTVNESRIKEAFLTAPAGIVNGNPVKAIFQMLIPMKRYMKTEEKRFLDKIIRSVFTEHDEFAVEFFGAILPNFKMDFTPIKNITRSEAAGIRTPLTIFAAEKDILFPGKKLIRRSESIFPSLKGSILLEGSRHVQSKIDNERIQSHILRE